MNRTADFFDRYLQGGCYDFDIDCDCKSDTRWKSVRTSARRFVGEMIQSLERKTRLVAAVFAGQ